MAKRKTIICAECGRKFRVNKNDRCTKYCKDCKDVVKKIQIKKDNRKKLNNREHTKVMDNEREKYLKRLHDRIIYDPNKDYIKHNDERYNENVGLRNNDLLSTKYDDENYYEYHMKLKKLKKELGL